MTVTRSLKSYADRICTGIEQIRASAAYQTLSVLEPTMAGSWIDAPGGAEPTADSVDAHQAVAAAVDNLLFQVAENAIAEDGEEVGDLVHRAAIEDVLAGLPVFAKRVASWTLDADWAERRARRRPFHVWLMDRAIHGDDGAQTFLAYFDDDETDEFDSLSALLARLLEQDASENVLICAAGLWEQYRADVPAPDEAELEDVTATFGPPSSEAVLPNALDAILQRFVFAPKMVSRGTLARMERRVRKALDEVDEHVEGHFGQDASVALDATIHALQSGPADESLGLVIDQALHGLAIANFLNEHRHALADRGVVRGRGSHFDVAPSFVYLLVCLYPDRTGVGRYRAGRYDLAKVLTRYGTRTRTSAGKARRNEAVRASPARRSVRGQVIMRGPVRTSARRKDRSDSASQPAVRTGRT